jgi:transcriptional regulator with XRE-family HTH domain
MSAIAGKPVKMPRRIKRPVEPHIQELTERRHALGLTHADLEALTGFCRTQFSSWETGARRPLPFSLHAWSEALGKAGDIVERLRVQRGNAICMEAADEIERLRAMIGG